MKYLFSAIASSAIPTSASMGPAADLETDVFNPGTGALVSEMTVACPDFQNATDLGLSAKVLEGEMSWP